MKFNPSKYQVLTISPSKSPSKTSYLITDLGSDSSVLNRVVSEVDLGVTVTSELSRNTHIKVFVSKVNKCLGILRTSPLLTGNTIRRELYLSLVDSQLSYAIQFCSPTLHTPKLTWRNCRGFRDVSQGGSFKQRKVAYQTKNGFCPSIFYHYDLGVLNFVPFQHKCQVIVVLVIVITLPLY